MVKRMTKTNVHLFGQLWIEATRGHQYFRQTGSSNTMPASPFLPSCWAQESCPHRYPQRSRFLQLPDVPWTGAAAAAAWEAWRWADLPVVERAATANSTETVAAERTVS